MTTTLTFNDLELSATNGIVVSDYSESYARGISSNRSLGGIGIRIVREEVEQLVIDIAGMIKADTESALAVRKKNLIRAFSARQPKMFSLNSSREIPASVSRDLVFKAVPGTCFTYQEFQVQLTCPYPVWRSTTGKYQALDISNAGRTHFTVTNDGDAAAKWRMNIITPEDFTDGYIELNNFSAGKVLRCVEFGLTSAELLVLDNGYHDITRIGAFQEAGGFPDPDFGITIDGTFWDLEPGNNTIVVDTNISDLSIDLFYYDSYLQGIV